jgi:mannose/fructose-specific phosphotransferase system component IIA
MTYQGVIITHGTMASCLVKTLYKITGTDAPLEAVSNEGKAPEEIVNALLKKYPEDDELPLFVFSEFKGGSTWFAAHKFANMRKNIFVFSGVNLPMLISFVTKQQNYSPIELADVILADSLRGITMKYYSF